MMEALRHNEGKIRLDLLPIGPLRQIAAVLAFGAEKYAEENWRGGHEFKSAYGSLLRHAMAWADGEDNDPESGLPHMAHVATNAIFLLEWAKTHPELDNRVRRRVSVLDRAEQIVNAPCPDVGEEYELAPAEGCCRMSHMGRLCVGCPLDHANPTIKPPV